jgi:RNA polymerase sigma factor (sigma-70 family)
MGVFCRARLHIHRCRGPPSFSEFWTTTKFRKTEEGKMSDKKYYIPIDGRKVEVTHEFYKAYRRMERREEYLEERDTVHGKALYSQLDTEETTGEEMIPDRDAVPIEEAVALALMVDKLHACMPKLRPCDRELLELRYWRGLSQKKTAAILKCGQASVSRREKKALHSLKEMLDK